MQDQVYTSVLNIPEIESGPRVVKKGDTQPMICTMAYNVRLTRGEQ